MRDSVADYLGALNETTYLPGLQREFVWSPAQIAELFDSLVRGYPVGLVVQWKIRRTAGEHVSYEFIRDYVADDGVVPDAVYEAGFDRYNEEADHGRYDTLVIDGQQRLNSILIGLAGSIARYEGGRGGSRADPNDWERQVLCVDLFGHPDYETGDLAGDYGFEFRRAEGFGEEDAFGVEGRDGTWHCWFPLREVVDEDGRTGSRRRLRRTVRGWAEAAPEEALGPEGTTSEELQDVAVGVVNDVVDKVLEQSLPSHEVTHGTEHVHEIFGRINTQGSTPRPHQLFLSELMSYWPYLREDTINPRAHIEAWTERFKAAYPGFQSLVDRELFVLYSCYLLGEDLGGPRSAREFDREDFDRLYDLWVEGGEDGDGRFDRFVTGLERALDTLSSVGLTERTVDSRAHLAVLAKFFYERDAPVDAANRNAVLHFFARLLLLPDSHGTLRRTRARTLREALDETGSTGGSTFPGERLFDALDVGPTREDVSRAVREARFVEDRVDGRQTLADGRVAAVLGLLETENVGTDTSVDAGDLRVSHVYPRSQANEFLPDGVPRGAVDRLGNLQLLDRETAEAKGEVPPAEWLDALDEERRTALLEAQQYPDVTPTAEAFESFVEAREERLVESLTERLVSGG